MAATKQNGMETPMMGNRPKVTPMATAKESCRVELPCRMRVSKGRPMYRWKLPRSSFSVTAFAPSAGRSSVFASSADMNPGPLLLNPDRPPQHLAGHGGGVSLSEEDELEHVGDGIPFRPAEVGVGGLARAFLRFEEDAGDGVWDRGGGGAKDAMPPHPHPAHLQGPREG